MKHKSNPDSSISVINERHVARVDKLFRMGAGASSRLTELRERSFTLKIKIDQRVSEEAAPQLIWDIAQSWRNHNPELKHCVMCMVDLHRSPAPTGFMLGSQSREDATAEMDPQEISARIREIKNASGLPAPLLAKYFLSFTLFEGISKIQDKPPVITEN